MNYVVTTSPTFFKHLKKLKEPALESRIRARIPSLELFPQRNKKLHGRLEGYYRMRIGKLRVLYSIQGEIVVLEGFVVGHHYERFNPTTFL